MKAGTETRSAGGTGATLSWMFSEGLIWKASTGLAQSLCGPNIYILNHEI